METAAERIRREIGSGGPMGCDRFLEIALHDREVGYYGSGRVRIGPSGDFVTAPHMSRLFAASLANLVAAADAALGRPSPFLLIEGGPGEGNLALDLLDALRSHHPDLYGRLAYAADETSPELRARQAARLQPHAARLAPFPQAPAAGLYLSNELLDAFPVRRVARRGGAWRELLIEATPEGFAESAERPAEGELARELALLGGLPGGDWKLEVRPCLGPWLEGVCARLLRGYVVTIDYGDLEGRLYGPHRPEGTLRAFREGRIVDDPFDRPGETDVTASVNFSALLRKGKALGLEAAPLLSQRDFLFALGIAEETARAETEVSGEAEAIALRQELWPLLFGGTGMGETFKALVQARDAPLDGLPLDPETALGTTFRD